ncbi:MAG TPA: hypothetical protein VHL57_00225 [Flavobacteriales bacterium]|jgi:hypothetical protein|nr:hypothetical protein [Flavobacteriales bacterium]
MSIHIAEIMIRPDRADGAMPLSTELQPDLQRAARNFIEDAWSRGWRGAGVMGKFPFGGREVTVTCMALQHLGTEQNEGQFLISHD